MIRTRAVFTALLLLSWVLDAGCLKKSSKKQKKSVRSDGSKSKPISVESQEPFTESAEDSELRSFSSEKARREEADRLFRLAQAYRDRNKMREAAETMDEVADIAFDNPDAQYHAGMSHLEVFNDIFLKMIGL